MDSAIQNESVLKLVAPTHNYAAQVMAYRQAMLKNGDSLDGCAGLEDTEVFSRWICFEDRLKKKYGENYVPSQVFLAVRREDDKVVGIIDLRRPLSPFLLKYGGNIGFSVHPARRGRGYAREMLRLMLAYCREQGEEKVLLTCDRSNAPSRKTIVANGGVLENEIPDDAGISRSGIIQRYWIRLK